MMEKELFLPQFRAILRDFCTWKCIYYVSDGYIHGGSGVAKPLLEKAKKQLKDEKTAYNENIEIGVMIETPAAVMISGELAREVDFFSIGTDDLLQLTLAWIVKIQNWTSIITHTTGFDEDDPNRSQQCTSGGKRISICGDLATDLSMTEFFVQIGIDELSVAPHQVLGLRKKIREIQ